MGTDNLELNIDDETLMAMIKNGDQPVGCHAKTLRNYYILAENSNGYAGRVVLKDFKAQLPLDELRRSRPDYQDKANLYLEVAGDYFPDLIEEDGVYLISEAFLACLQKTIHLRAQYIYSYLGLCTANNASIHTYCLLVPPQFDCILPGSARYDRAHCLTYFEIDETKIGKAEIFRVKGFPHLLITRPISHLSSAGFQCTRIENYFDYAGVRDQDYQERLKGQRLTAALQEYERQIAVCGNYRCKYDLTAIVELRAVRQEAAAGLRAVFQSYQGPVFPAADLSARSLTFKSMGPEGKIVLTEETGFSQTEFTLTFVVKALRYLETVPEVLRASGREIVYETILAALSQEGRIFDNFEPIHGGQRFRLYFESDLIKTTNPWLVYDYQNATQRAIPDMFDFRRFKWQDQDLREYDFSGQTLSGLKISSADLTGARFNGCNLTNTEFSGCNLTGVEFQQAKLQGAKFIDNELSQASFNYADLREATISGSCLQHTSFIKTDLTKVNITNSDLLLAYFYRAKLNNAVFAIDGILAENSFRLCDLRNARFIKASDANGLKCIMVNCDFQNSDLDDCRFTVDQIIKTKFNKTKLIGADFAQCQFISQSDFRNSICHEMNLAGVILHKNNFAKVDLSQIKTKSGNRLVGNDFTAANLAGYDFTQEVYQDANCLINTNLSNCNLAGSDFTTSQVNLTKFNGAKLAEALFTAEQLPFFKLDSEQSKVIKVQTSGEDFDVADTEETSVINGEFDDNAHFEKDGGE